MTQKNKYLNRAEKHLNSIPTNKRKIYFFIVFGVLLLFIVIKLIFSLEPSSTDNTTTTKDTITLKNIPNLYIGDTLSQEQLDMLNSIK